MKDNLAYIAHYLNEPECDCYICVGEWEEEENDLVQWRHVVPDEDAVTPRMLVNVAMEGRIF